MVSLQSKNSEQMDEINISTSDTTCYLALENFKHTPVANIGTSVNRKDLISKQATQAHKFHLSEHDKPLIPNQAVLKKNL